MDLPFACLRPALGDRQLQRSFAGKVEGADTDNVPTLMQPFWSAASGGMDNVHSVACRGSPAGMAAVFPADLPQQPRTVACRPSSPSLTVRR